MGVRGGGGKRGVGGAVVKKGPDYSRARLLTDTKNTPTCRKKSKPSSKITRRITGCYNPTPAPQLTPLPPPQRPHLLSLSAN